MSERMATVIIPTLSAERCKSVIRSLENEGSSFEMIVVDNRDPASVAADPVPESAERRVLVPGRNLGYSAAVNLAAREAKGDSLVLLNDDCSVDPGFVSRISAAIDPANGVTMAAGVMRQAQDPETIDSAGMELDSTLLVFDYLNGQPLSILDEHVADPVGPSGAAAAFDREAFLEVGGFDENLFAYWEDVDLVLRLREVGGSCRLVSDARGTHQHSMTLGSGSAEKNRLMGFGRGYVMRKWGVLTPTRLPSVIAREIPISLGQLLIDRNAEGLRGRVVGLKASPERHEYPKDLPSPPGLRENLTRRWKRRGGLRMAPSHGPVLVAFHSALIGGPLRSLENEIRWLAGVHETRILIPAGEEPDPLLSGLASEVTRLPYSVPALGGNLLGTLAVLRDQRRQIKILRAFLRKERPAAILAVTTAIPSVITAARLERIPMVLYAAELPQEVVPGVGRTTLAARRLQRRFSNRLGSAGAEVVLACSPAVSDALSTDCPVLVQYPAIDPALSQGDGPAFRRRLGIPPEARVISCIGSISPGRGQRVLIEALPEILERIPGAVLVLAGSPFPRPADLAYSARLDELTGDLGVADFVRRIPRVEPVGKLLAASDLVVNPALTHAETFGRVAFEAGYAGVPSVATRVGAVPGIHRDGETIRLVDPADSDQLATASIELLEDPDLAHRLASGAAALAADISSPENSLRVFQEAMRIVGIQSA